jgi:hypothetical protein
MGGLQKIGCPESFTGPREPYQLARLRGILREPRCFRNPAGGLAIGFAM